MKTLTELRAECDRLGVRVTPEGRAGKEPYVAALRDYHWLKDHPDEPLPAQIMPMLLGSWEDLDDAEAEAIEQDHHAWIVQPKLDGIRAVLHVEEGGVRITSRCVSETTFRLGEFQGNVPHLGRGFSGLVGTVLDGELVCPVPVIDSGSTITASGLQAAVAILSTTPESAQRVQERNDARLRFYAFDILRSRGRDVTPLPLVERLNFLAHALRDADNPHLEMVPSFMIGKGNVHRGIIEAGGEGSVWKRVDRPYQSDRRVEHWLKRKRGIEAEAFVSGFKTGNNGHASMVGAVEFSIRQADGSSAPVAWVSSWSDQDRRSMTHVDPTGEVTLNPSYLGRLALIEGQDRSAKSRRIRHARLRLWLDS
jgi:ATP-dependent DNA ligase